jgi:hypothetical protein
MAVHTIITHWFPIVTFCPVNNLPDFIFVKCTFDKFEELYEVRRRIRRAVQWKKMYMEEVCERIQQEFQQATTIEVSLMFGKHTVKFTKE